MRSWRLALWSMAFAQLLCVAGWQASPPFFPYYIRELGVSDPTAVKMWAGALTSADAASMALLSPVWGMIADRLGPRVMVQRAALGGFLFLFLQAFATNVSQLFGLRLLLGAATGTIPAFITLVAFIAPEEEAGWALGVMQMSVYGGLSLGPVLGGIVADHYGYRWIFVGSAVLFFLALCFVTVALPGSWAGHRTRTSSARASKGVRSLLRSPGVLVSMLVLIFMTLGNNAYRPLLPLLVESLPVASELVNRTTGLAFAAAAATAAASALIVGRLSDRIGVRTMLVICATGAGLGLLAQGLAESIFTLIVTTSLSGLFIGGLAPTANAFIARVSRGDSVGTLYGISNSLNSAAKAVAPMIGVWIAALFGVRPGFVASAALFSMILLLVPVVKQRALSPAGAAGGPDAGGT